LAKLGILSSLVFMMSSGSFAQTTVYDATSNPLPPSIASLGYQSNGAAEFGDYVHLAGTDRFLKTVTVTMTDFALFADYSTDARYSGNSSTWPHPVTINVYNVVPGAPLNQAGSLLATKTITANIPWRPVADPTCADPTRWRSPVDNQCYAGIAFNVTFDLSIQNVALPNDIVIGLAFNTETYGANPIGVTGPYIGLNIGVQGSATVGTDDDTDRVFWNTTVAGNYADGGTGGVAIFREDTNWTPFGTTPFKVTAGLAPTAAKVSISGRVMSASGAGVRGATVTVQDSRGHKLMAITNAFGYYTFASVPSGDTYIGQATSRGLTFGPRVVTVNDAISDLDLVAR